MRFKDLQELCAAGNISPKEYKSKMFEKYTELFEYKELINQSHVSKIEIDGKEIIFTITNQNIKNEPYDISMVFCENDVTAIPADELSITSGYEPNELAMAGMLCSYLKENSIFLDAGANLGWYSLNLCRQYPHLHSYAFEPILETYNRLRRNVELNRLNNCSTFQIGLSDENKKVSFFYNIEESGASSMVDLREAGTAKEVECEVRCLDDFIESENMKGLDFIKCDVEGSELLVFRGALKSIQKYKPVIFSEMLRKWSAKFNYHPNDIICLLGDIGYQCYVLAGNNKLKKFGYVDGNTVETNYFFLCPDVHKKMIEDLCIP